MRYVIEKDGERQNVSSLEGHEDWTVISEVDDELPDPEAELVDGAWVVPLDILKQRKWEDAKIYRDFRRSTGCATPKGRMDSDEESKVKLNGAVTMAQLVGDTFSVNWTMEDNSVVTHNKAEIDAAGLAVGQYDMQCHAVGQSLREQIDAATTAAELDAIDIEGAAWPG
jgi:phage-related tail fiber protein